MCRLKKKDLRIKKLIFKDYSAPVSKNIIDKKDHKDKYIWDMQSKIFFQPSKKQDILFFI